MLAGLDTREHGPAHLGGRAGVLFQDPETQLVMSSVRAELALGLESRGHSAAAVARGSPRFLIPAFSYRYREARSASS